MSSAVGGAAGAAVRDLNRWSVPGVGRDYQLQLLTTGTLLIDGQQRPYSTLPISYDRFELRPLDSDSPTLVTQDASSGWEITGVVVGDAVAALPPNDDDRELVVLPDATRLLSEARTRGHVDLAPGAPRVVRVGHWNFAHALWNNLPALMHWEETVAHLAATGLVRCELTPWASGQLWSLGSESELLPLLADHPADEGPDWPAPNTIRLGSALVTNEVRHRVTSSLARRAPLPGRRPRLWLGHRHPSEGRAPTNVDDLYTAIAARWLSQTGGSVVLDGFTPEGFDRLSGWMAARAQASHRSLHSIARRVRASGPWPSDSVITTAGRSLRQALALASTAEYLVSLPGTVQHKVGWVWNPPSTVLISPIDGAESHARWPGLQVEGGEIPSHLPSRFLAFDEHPLDTRDERINDDFRVVDVEAAADWTVTRALSALAGRA